jgi:hypothetical protein
MANESDYGYSQIDWEHTKPENVKLVESEYRQAMAQTLAPPRQEEHNRLAYRNRAIR